jgi:hypothetical protein
MAIADGDARGFVRADTAGVRAAFEQNFTDGNEVGACFCATVDGETVADLVGGTTRRTTRGSTRRWPTLASGAPPR